MRGRKGTSAKQDLEKGEGVLRCPFCGEMESKVLDSRPTDEGNTIRRRRECISCSKRFTTYEKVEVIPLVVIKKDGRREAFDRNKILKGMMTACEKRPISLHVLEEAADDIERTLRSRWEKEVESREIGELVMERLRDLDEVAYVRFASVYWQFKDINRFMEELQNLLNKG